MNGDGGPPLCGSGKECVKAGGQCQCAAPCTSGEFQCSGGQQCVDATSSNTGANIGLYCVPSSALCKTDTDCAARTLKDAAGKATCAPLGTDPDGCKNTPACKCLGTSGCQEPCFNVQCGSAEVCAQFGPNAGKCVTDTCYLTTCAGCDKACNLGACVDNPCKAATCKATEECKPNDNFTTYECVKSCANVACKQDELCRAGVCIAACSPPCATGKVCDASTKTCVTNQCSGTSNGCADGACCDPLTGQCGNCPCEGVLCPKGQRCETSECVVSGTGGTGGTGGSGPADGGLGGTGGNDAGTSDASAGTGGGPPTEPEAKGVWGLATGGGGCACTVGTESNSGHKLLAAGVMALALALGRRGNRSKSAAARRDGGAR